MFDFFIFMKDDIDKSYDKFKRIFESYGIKPNDGMKSFFGTYNEGHYYFNFSSDIEYSKMELMTVPYKVICTCDITFIPYETLYFLIDKIIDFDSQFYVDDDHDNIMNVCKYKEKMLMKNVYPYIRE